MSCFCDLRGWLTGGGELWVGFLGGFGGGLYVCVVWTKYNGICVICLQMPKGNVACANWYALIVNIYRAGKYIEYILISLCVVFNGHSQSVIQDYKYVDVIVSGYF